MPELKIEKPMTLDILDLKSPALSSTSDMPVIETKPDASPAPAATEPKKAEVKTPSESATEPAEPAASDEPAPKPAKGVQKRLDELVRQRVEAEARAKAAEENLRLALEASRPAPAEPKAQPQEEEPEPKRPAKSDFTDPEAWDAAVLAYADEKAAYVARREVKAARAEDEQKRLDTAQAEAGRALREVHAARVEKAKTKYADFSEVAESPDVHISIPMAHAILNHEQGPDIQYFLGKNAAEAQRIAKLAPHMQLVELGMIAASLRAPAAPAAEPVAETPKPITKAPPPISPVSSGKADVTKTPEDETMEEYAARRKKELNSERRPGVRH
jgi:hypothetical protein